uniref:F-box only protein 3-like n=1 Tax=Styela clava TaxID=7725 RepID=UPI00193AA6B7|nr:F-box only protein 3-like [Styela clava]
MSVSPGLLDLPNEVLLHIFSFLELDDLNRVFLTSWRCKQLSENEQLWKTLCKKHWLLTERKSNSETWKENFILYYKDFGRYIQSYPIIFSSWTNLIDILRIHSPKIISTLKDGLSESDLDQFEEEYTCKLPEALRLFYRICGGQDSQDSNTPGLFGSFANVYAVDLNNYIFRSLPCLTQVHSHLEKSDVNSQLLTLCDTNCGIDYCLVLPHTISKEVTHMEGAPKPYSVVWTSANQIFSAFNSFEEWFLDYVEKVSFGQYHIDGGLILRYDYEPEFVAQTGPITVKAGWTRSQALAHENMLFEYRITMSMDEDAKPADSCRLLERHWIIKHFENGKEEKVSGPGVVGEFPVMKPGSKYSWMSRTYFQISRWINGRTFHNAKSQNFKYN